jgi:hypothetical protein
MALRAHVRERRAGFDESRVEIGAEHTARGAGLFGHPARNAAATTAHFEAVPAGCNSSARQRALRGLVEQSCQHAHALGAFGIGVGE